ncbi:ABC transporter ATP-binding protein [Chrysiogenes arsenatis]|uniref:ABC transporter ATP-binding protein n=1 Tax=Chrysiogenes arsenatis TaxID=309797 RepID=UPI00054F9F90|nr:ABC transporter ATP-binding protein [Chrysiogenes arsenatis]
MNILIAAQNLQKNYHTFQALRGLSFCVTSGECVGIIGPNGAGKTTLMRILSCYFPATSGTVEIFGLNVNQAAREIKSRMGIVPQEDNLDLDLTVLENLVVYANYFGISTLESTTRAIQLLQEVELHEKRNAPIRALSGGMKRRLTIIRGLINRPELVILDEPTTGLDPYSRRLVWQKLDTLRQQGTTLLLTTHYMEEAERLCDRVALIDNGELIALDTPANLIQHHQCQTLEEVYLTLTGRPLVR